MSGAAAGESCGELESNGAIEKMQRNRKETALAVPVRGARPRLSPSLTHSALFVLSFGALADFGGKKRIPPHGERNLFLRCADESQRQQRASASLGWWWRARSPRGALANASLTL